MENNDNGGGNWIPERSTLGQVCDVVGKWLEGHPEEWNKPKALKEAFPIQKRSVKKGCRLSMLLISFLI
ncbi:MAG: hypothetical protein HKK66_06415 [Chlorobiaceae bacterium]|nr:hypothetical protein [Chlorobiaceae bacterium]